MESVAHSSVCEKQGFRKSTWCFHQFFSPLSHVFSLTLIYTYTQSFCLQNRLVPCFLVFLAIVTPFLVLLITSKSELLCWSPSLCLLMSDLCCHWLSLGWPLTPAASWRQLQGDGGRAGSFTFTVTLSTATAGHACQSQPRTSSSFPTQEMHCVSLTL